MKSKSIRILQVGSDLNFLKRFEKLKKDLFEVYIFDAQALDAQYEDSKNIISHDN